MQKYTVWQFGKKVVLKTEKSINLANVHVSLACRKTSHTLIAIRQKIVLKIIWLSLRGQIKETKMQRSKTKVKQNILKTNSVMIYQTQQNQNNSIEKNTSE